MWKYESPIGNIYIQKLPDGLFGMVFNNVVWEACDTAQTEADNIFMQCTGCSQWDMCDTSHAMVPHDLSEWEKV